jgi:hypothetical protein
MKKQPARFDYKFYLGIVMFIGGWYLCLDYVWLLLGLPILLGGVIMVGLSRKKLWIRLAAIFGIFLVWFPIAYFGFKSVNQLPAKIYLIPESLQSGHFRVVYESKCGVIPKMENGKIVLEIPANGILATQQEYQKENWNAEYYLVDKSGKRTRILQDSTHRFEDPDVIRPTVYFLGTAGADDLRGLKSRSKIGCIYDLFLFFNNDGIVPDDLLNDPHQDELMDAQSHKLRNDFFGGKY